MADSKSECYEANIKTRSLDESCVEVSVISSKCASDDEKLKGSFSRASSTSHPSDSGIIAESTSKSSEDDLDDPYDDDDDLEKPLEKKVDVYFVILATALGAILIGAMLYFAVSPMVEDVERTFEISIPEPVTKTIVTTQQDDTTAVLVPTVTTVLPYEYEIEYEFD
ncbi:hypothetical protein CAPTEDRAFT_185493 [Capitella teleta]|uniref:Uncharacterized protein n=1 Tax=Capitella teleta TaxID=283909 RepID=R7VK70_CAPTE|nr:hypothetical protein CAPTEDRAFT_185493 [Capitella teleta]|eukprot:ELU16530.1 hypothetical protein CAPTEDRAFT_185493 [Capitella teleta]